MVTNRNCIVVLSYFELLIAWVKKNADLTVLMVFFLYIKFQWDICDLYGPQTLRGHESALSTSWNSNLNFFFIDKVLYEG